MALSDYKMTATGGVRAPKRAKQALLSDLKKAAKSPQEMGLSKSQREGMVDEANVAAQQQARAAAENLATAGLSSGWSGQTAEAARQAQRSSAGAAAAASAGAQQLSQQLARQRYDQTRARLEAQQERSRQNAQYWGGKAVDAAAAAAGAANPTK